MVTMVNMDDAVLSNTLDPLDAHFLSLWVQSWHFAWAGVWKMNVITVKLRRPTIPKAPQAAKIILGGLKQRGRCSVSYCCSVTQTRGTPMGTQGWALLFKRAPSAFCSCPPLSHEESPPAPTWRPPISNSGHFSSHGKSMGFISMVMVPLGPGAFRETVGSANSIQLHSALIAATVWKELKRKRDMREGE